MSSHSVQVVPPKIEAVAVDLRVISWELVRLRIEQALAEAELDRECARILRDRRS